MTFLSDELSYQTKWQSTHLTCHMKYKKIKPIFDIGLVLVNISNVVTIYEGVKDITLHIICFMILLDIFAPITLKDTLQFLYRRQNTVWRTSA